MTRICGTHGPYSGPYCPVCWSTGVIYTVADPGRVRMCGMSGFTSPTDRAEDGVPQAVAAMGSDLVPWYQTHVRALESENAALRDRLRRIAAICEVLK